jgi:hypothetical protein
VVHPDFAAARGDLRATTVGRFVLPPAEIGAWMPEIVFDALRGGVTCIVPPYRGGEMRAWSWNGQAWTRVATTGATNGWYNFLAAGAVSWPGRNEIAVLGYLSSGGAQNIVSLNTQNQWTQVALGQPGLGSVGSEYDFQAPLADDPTDGVVILAPIYQGGPIYTWRFDGIWRVVATTSPTRRRSGAVATDTHRGRLVLYGGYGGSYTVLDDLWEWDGTSWMQIPQLPGGVGGRAGAAMEYDPISQRVMLFGGQLPNFGYSRETWAWDGAMWTLLSTNGPAVINRASMVFDEARGRMVLVNGAFYGSGIVETFEWDGTRWELRATSERPQPSDSKWFDPNRGKVVLFDNGMTWTWDGTAWTALGGTPPTGAASASSHSGTFDRSLHRAVVFTMSGTTSICRDSEPFRFTQIPPEITRFCPNRPLQVSVDVDSTVPVTYQWYWLEEIGTSHPYVGQTSRVLSLPNPTYADRRILCSVSSPCGVSAAIQTTLVHCQADLDDGSGSGRCDAVVDVSDLLYYLEMFGQGSVAADYAYPRDGGVTIEDLLVFLMNYLNGC